MSGVDLSRLSTSDLMQIKNGNIKMLSEEGLRILANISPPSNEMKTSMADVVKSSDGMDTFLSQIGAGAVKTGDAMGLVDPQTAEDFKMLAGANRSARPFTSFAGDATGLAGQAYLGGNLLKAISPLASAIPQVSNALRTAGSSLIAPQSMQQAAVAGGALGLATTPGDIADRAKESIYGMVGGPVGYGIGKATGAGLGAIWDRTKQLASSYRPMSVSELDDLITRRFVSVEQFNSLPDLGKQALRQMAQEATANNGNLTPEIMQRMAEMQSAGILKPLKGWVSGDPLEWNQAHSLQGVDPTITQRYSDAHSAMLDKVTGMAPKATDYALGNQFKSTIQSKYDLLKKDAGVLYDKFRSMGGMDIPLDGVRFNNNVAREIDSKMLGGKLKESDPDIINWFGKVQSGAEPFTFSSAAQRLESINRKIYNSRDEEQKLALNTIKSALLDELNSANVSSMPTVAGSNMTGQATLAKAFQDARDAASKYFKFAETSPLHDAVVSGKFTPEQLPDLIKRIKVDDLKAMANADMQYGTRAVQDLRNAAAAFVRDSATLRDGREFTVAGLRKAMDQIGEENGSLLFGKQWQELQSLRSAAGNIMDKRAGVIPANSGTAQMLANILQKLPGTGTAVNIGVRLANSAQRANLTQGQLNGVQFKPLNLMELTQKNLSQPGGVGGLLGFYGAEGMRP